MQAVCSEENKHVEVMVVFEGGPKNAERDADGAQDDVRDVMRNAEVVEFPWCPDIVCGLILSVVGSCLWSATNVPGNGG